MKNKTTCAIVNCQLVLEQGIIWDAVVLLSGDRIEKFGGVRDIEIPDGIEIIDAEGAYVGPGFVDIHVHGNGGYQTFENPAEAEEFMLKHGATTILATPYYDLPFDEFLKAIRTVKEYMPKARTIKGFYMEGPYINPKYGCFAYNNPWRHPIDAKEYEALVDEAGKYARVWTIAPEREGLVPFLKYARKVNPDVIFSLGHSEATPMQIRALGKYRPTIQTHSMNATGRLPVYAGTRAYGPDEYSFKENEVYTELISDSCCIHVHKEMQQLLLHCKGVDKIILITDSTVYNEPVPEKFAHVTDLNFDSQGGIAGSKMTMEQACKNIMTHTNCGIAQAFLMASGNPARAVGLDDEIGSVDVGKKADLVIVDDRFNVKKVILGGKLCNFD